MNYLEIWFPKDKIRLSIRKKWLKKSSLNPEAAANLYKYKFLKINIMLRASNINEKVPHPHTAIVTPNQYGYCPIIKLETCRVEELKPIIK